MRLVIIDGNAVLHRAYHALPPLTTRSGEIGNAVYGFISMLYRVKVELKPDYLTICFDRPKPTFRQAIFVGYQAKRPKMDEELAGQIEKVHEVVSAMKIPIYEIDGYEADDVIGTLVCKVKSQKSKVKTVIVTGDRDLMQLVNGDVELYMPTKGISEAKLYGEKEVEEKFGVKTRQFIDYKALIGDSSDNYCGVSGIGPKTASKLLVEYNTLENIYHNLHKLPEIVRQKLESGKDSAELAKKLAAIMLDVPIQFNLEEAKLDSLATPEAIEVLKKLEFHSLLKRLPGYENPIEEKKQSKVSENQLGLF